MVNVNLQRIDGKWTSGIALDLHTTNSIYLGTDENGYSQFDNTYSDLGGLLNKLKYHADQSAATDIIAAASAIVLRQRDMFDLIVPVPPSTPRPVQPVITLANGIGAAVGLPVAQCISTTRPTGPIKSISDPAQRAAALVGLYAVNPAVTTGKNILLFDDLFRSGATMNAITDVLLQDGRANRVHVLTITRTRVHR